MNSEIMPMPEPEEKQTRGSLFQRTWNSLIEPSKRLTDIGEQRSARLAASFLFAIAVLDLIGILVRARRVGLVDSFLSAIGYAFIALVITYLLSRTHLYRAAVFLFSLSFSALAYITIISQGNEADMGALILIYVPLSLIVASSFLSSWLVFLLVSLNVGAYLSIRVFGINWPDNIGAQAGIILAIGVVLILLTNFRNATEKLRLSELRNINQELEVLSNQLEQRVEERTHELVAANQQTMRRSEQLTAIAELARSITDVPSLDSLLPTITNFISQRLGYYHVGIFLNDTQNFFAVLRAANSPGGYKMLDRGHRLRIGQEGIVGYAIHSGQPRIALDVGSDAVYFDNPDLPDTHSELAIPLRIGTEIIGALDIQSTEPNAFSTDDMPVFTTLADQVAVAIQNARLLNQAQAALQELEEAYAEQAGQAWKSFAQTQALNGYRFNGIEPLPIIQGDQTQLDTNLTDLVLPIRLRGQTIGKLKLKTTDQTRTWTNEEVALAKATIERAAIALENARLLEDAQRRAQTERAISEMSSRIASISDIDTILETTLAELRKNVQDTDVIIQFSTADKLQD